MALTSCQAAPVEALDASLTDDVWVNGIPAPGSILEWHQHPAAGEFAIPLNTWRLHWFQYQPADVRGAFVALVRKHAALVAVSATDESNLVPPCRDPKNNQFLALVLACEADALVSSDAELLVLNPWRSIPILTPGASLLFAQRD